MNAEIAGKLVAKFIEKQWPNDREDVLEIIRLGVNKAWQEGKWIGMTAEFFMPIYKDAAGQSYFMAPQSHPNLLAINGVNNGMTIRDPYFMFHRNGYGDIRNSAGCNWNQDVFDVGATPYYDRSNIDFSKGVTIGIRSLGPVGDNEEIYINGTHTDGEKVITYDKSDFGNPCGCDGKDYEVAINGAKIKIINNNFLYLNNVKFASITSITKSTTKSPIEVIAIDCYGVGHQIARMEGNQRFSKYRKYLVPNNLCGKKSLHALFKCGQQELLVNPTDEVIISNEEALISLAKGIYFMYYKERPEEGAGFILQGFSVLEKERREEDAPSEFPIQVDGIVYSDLPHALRHHS